MAGVRTESDVMTPAGTNSRSALDKPVGELTEEDILQLTREDCRRFLIEKGMRRPSWNKSQAIQQVISLKTLLQRRPESGYSGDGFRQRVPVHGPENPPHIAFSSPPLQVSGSNLQTAVSANENGSDRGRDSLLLSFSRDATCHLPATGGQNICAISPSRRDGAGMNGPVGQMTIFYCGNVNVYEGVSADKALAIMQLAGSPNSLPNDPPCVDSSAIAPFLVRLPTECIRPNTSSPPFTTVISATLQTGKIPQYSKENSEDWRISREIELEGPTSRKASLQRYLEKRKDRGRFKGKKKIGGSSSSLEMYLPHQVSGQTPNVHSNRSGTCSPTQPRPPHTPTRCSSVENQVKNLQLSVDLNDDDVQEV